MQKKTIVIGGAVVGGLLCVLLVAVALVAISFHGVSSRGVREEEKHQLITVDKLAAYAEIPGNRSLCESYTAKRNIDGSLELEYAYDTDNDPNAEEFLFLKSEAEMSDTLRLAQESFAGRVSAYKMGTSLVAGRNVQEKPGLFLLGEDNFAAIVAQDSKVIGNIVVTRKGTTVHSLLLYGIYFDEREPLESLFESAMR